MKQILLYFISTVLLCASAAACGSSPGEKNATRTQEKLNVFATQTNSARLLDPCSDSEVVRVVWDISGGSDIKFVIDKNEAGYRLYVERYDYKAVDQELSLADADPYLDQLIETTFTTPRYLLYYFNEIDWPTGTRTTITVICADDQSVLYDNDFPWEDSCCPGGTSVCSLYLFVDQAMQAVESSP